MSFALLIFSDRTIVMPSAYSRIRNRTNKQAETISKDGCWLRYIEGDRSDLKDVEWYWGSAALNQPEYELLHEDTKRKAIYALESILADLTVLDMPSSRIDISISSHKPEKWADSIIKAVAGVHLVEFKTALNGKTQQHYDINVVEVFPEGYGSIAYCLYGGDSQNKLDLDGSAIALGMDFGTSTTILTVFDGNGAAIKRYPIEQGTGQLYTKISQLMDTSNQAVNKIGSDKAVEIDVIRRSVEDGSFKVGNGVWGRPFKEQFDRAFEWWFGGIIQGFEQFIIDRNYSDKIQFLAAWGGGLQTPGVVDRLGEYDAIALREPQLINAKGLHLLTQVYLEG